MNKKDYNYIAAVEKAIAEKYGKETVQDFRSSWDSEKEKIYLQQLKEDRGRKQSKQNTEEIETPFYRIKKTKKTKKPQRSCPVCKTYSFSSKDDLYMNRFECCYNCYIDFVDDRLERWESGWRPDEEHLQTYLRRRKNGNSPRRN